MDAAFGHGRLIHLRSVLFAAAFMALAASGAAALAHELLWTRRLIDLLGASNASNARVFGGFFLGMALGAGCAPWLLSRVARPWRAAAVSEVGVAVCALPGLLLPYWTSALWSRLGTAGLMTWQGNVAKLVLSMLVVVPPAFFMGLTLPLIVFAVTQSGSRPERHGIWLYAINTAGGVVGLVAVVLWTLRHAGVPGSMILAMTVNLVAAGVCLAADHLAAHHSRQENSPNRRHSTAIVDRYDLHLEIMAFLSGGSILAFEVVAVQMMNQVAPLSFFAPAALLAAIILYLALAAVLLPMVITRLERLAVARVVNRRLLPACENADRGGRVAHSTHDAVTAGRQRCRHLVMWMAIVGGAAGMLATPWLFAGVTRFYYPGPAATLAWFMAHLVGVSLLAFGPAIVLSGAVFPTTLYLFGGTTHSDRARRWGRLLAINGVGGVVGAELAYRVLLPEIGIRGSIGAVACLYGIAAVFWSLSPLSPSTRNWRLVVASTAVVAVAIGALAGPLRTWPDVRVDGGQLLDIRAGREGTVAVVQTPDLGRRIIVSDQYVLGGTKLRYDQARLAHIPLVLHPRPATVSVIGLATGITPGAALEHDAVKSLTIMELSPLVVRAAERFFDDVNHGVTRDPRSTLITEDGRTYLAAAGAQFDVVIGDLFLPWSPGSGRLYSVEHFRNVRRSLRPGGLYCQWLAMYQLTPRQFDIIVHTFHQVFPNIYVFRHSFDSRYPAIGLVGYRDATLDWQTIENRCQQLRAADSVRDVLVRHGEGIAMLSLGTIDDARPEAVPVNTLSNMVIELAAGQQRVTGDPAAKYISQDRWLSFVYDRFVRQLGRADHRSRDQLQLAWLGQCLSLWQSLQANAHDLAPADAAQIPRLAQEIGSAFPAALANDHAADEMQWPGDPAWLRDDGQPNGP